MPRQENKKPLSETKLITLNPSTSAPDSKTLLAIRKVNPYGYYRAEESSGENIRLWDTETGEQKASIGHEIETLEFFHFSPDSKTLVTIGTQKKTGSYGYSRSGGNSSKKIDFWDVNTGKQKTSSSHEIGNFKSIKFSPDSKTLIGVTTPEIYFWDIETGKSKTTLPKSPSNVESTVFSSDSRLLLAVSTNEVNDTVYDDTEESKTRTFCFLDVETGKPISTHLEEMTHNIKFLTFNFDKTKFASVHSDNLIRLWDVNTGKHVSTLEGAQGNIASVAFSMDNRTLACGSKNGKILLWDITK